MDILRCTSLICNKLHVLNKLAWLLTRVSRHHHDNAFKNTSLVQSMEWRYVHTCSFIYRTSKIHWTVSFWCRILLNLSTLSSSSYFLRESVRSTLRVWRGLLKKYFRSIIESSSQNRGQYWIVSQFWDWYWPIGQSINPIIESIIQHWASFWSLRLEELGFWPPICPKAKLWRANIGQ